MFFRLTDLGGVGKKMSQGSLVGDVKALNVLQSPKLRRSHSMSEVPSELGVNSQSLVKRVL